MTLIRPFVNLISQVSLAKRFIIIVSLVFFSLIYLEYGLVKNYLGVSHSIKLELRGINLLIPTTNIISTLQDLRNVSVVGQYSPSSENKEKIAELTARCDKNFVTLSSFVERNPELNLDEAFNKLYQNWTEVKKNQTDADKDQFHLYDDFIDEPKRFLVILSARSQLNLDPDNDNYYFIQMISWQIPELEESFSMLRDLADKSLGAKKLDSYTLNYIGQSLAIFAANLDAIKTSNQFITAKDAKYTGKIDNLINKINNFNIEQKIKEHILNGKLDLNLKSFDQYITKLVSLTQYNFNQLITLVDNKLQLKLHTINNNLITLMIFSGCLVVFISLFFIAFYESTKESLSAAIGTANQIAEGNLGANIYDKAKDDFKSLFTAFGSMKNNLNQLVTEINEVSHTVNYSAREISSGSSNLSERTQDQASALVETVASLGHLTSTVKNNAASSRNASELAAKSSRIAEEGRDAVGKVLVTMEKINESSQKIQEITSVIDGIAFQTNLLALNASVEAARAGEQGRGFAVVASEVRNLARRSSDAAKEIKKLIDDSLSKVDAGNKQVQVTASTMQEIVNAILEVNENIKLISVSSTEQSNGIEQINIVVAGMETTTQKNAALVQEAAASAELLEKQSTKLLDLVSSFNVEKD